MTLAEARANVGAPVVYRPPDRALGIPGEDGVITKTNDTWVFVKYGSNRHSIATHPHDLELLLRRATP